MLVGVRGVIGGVSGGCFVVFLVLERWLGGGFVTVFCRVERRRREKIEKVS